jgi:rod shape-determining protein MreC
MTISTPFQSGLGSSVDWFSDQWKSYLELRGVREENQRLRAALAQSSSDEVALRDRLSALRHLEQVLESGSAAGFQKIPARVIARDPNRLFGTIIIDKGSIHGVRKDQPVVDSGGLVGRVVLVTPLSSRVILVTDERHGAGALITTTVTDRVLGVIRGVGDNYYCRMDFITTPVQLDNGELVVTSGQDGLYPPGLLLGRVANPAEWAGSTQQRMVVAPAANLGRLESVLVLQVSREQVRAGIDAVSAEEQRQEAEASRRK